MDGPLKTLSEQPHAAIVEFVRGDLRNKAAICEAALKEARKLSQLGKHGMPLIQLVSRARELCDDMVEMLPTLGPEGDRGESTTAATLQRQLEQLEAAITEHRRAAAGKSDSSPKC